jgi:hypothetical protein
VQSMQGLMRAVDARIDALVVLARGLNGALQRIVQDDEGFGGAVDAGIKALGVRRLGGGCRLVCTTAQRRLSLGLYDSSKEAVAWLVGVCRRLGGACRWLLVGGQLSTAFISEAAVDAVVAVGGAATARRRLSRAAGALSGGFLCMCLLSSAFGALYVFPLLSFRHCFPPVLGFRRTQYYGVLLVEFASKSVSITPIDFFATERRANSTDAL